MGCHQYAEPMTGARWPNWPPVTSPHSGDSHIVVTAKTPVSYDLSPLSPLSPVCCAHIERTETQRVFKLTGDSGDSLSMRAPEARVTPSWLGCLYQRETKRGRQSRRSAAGVRALGRWPMRRAEGRNDPPPSLGSFPHSGGVAGIAPALDIAVCKFFLIEGHTFDEQKSN